MNILDFALHSGGALGSDHEWDTQARANGLTDIRHYWHGTKTPYGNVELTDAQLEEGWQRVLLANKTLKRKPDGYKSLLSRNWFQVKNSAAVFAIGTLTSVPLSDDCSMVDGGTGWAVQMAIDDFMDVYVFDQDKGKWFTYNYDKDCFIVCPIPLLRRHSACIGTRQINTAGVKAITSVFKRALLQ